MKRVDETVAEQLYNEWSEYSSARTVPVEKVPFEVAGVGSGRVALRSGGTVYKIAVGTGVNQNRAESRICNYLYDEYDESTVETMIAPVLESDADNRWLQMPFVEIREKESAFSRVRSQLADSGVAVFDVGTGMYEGNLVAYDYGQGSPSI